MKKAKKIQVKTEDFYHINKVRRVYRRIKMNLWLTIDADGAAVWQEEPELQGECYWFDGDGNEPPYLMVNAKEANALCGNPKLPFITKVRLEVVK